MEVVFSKGTMLSVSDKSVSVNERTDIQIVLPEVSVRFGSILVFTVFSSVAIYLRNESHLQLPK